MRRDFRRLMSANGFGPRWSDLRPEREPRPPLWRRGWKWWLTRVSVGLPLLLALAVVGALMAPLPYDPPAPPQTAFAFDRHGRFIARISAEEERTVVPLRRIPEQVRQAFIAAEDERFYGHGGVDFKAILRALWADVSGGRFQGASTITQQLIRNVSSPTLDNATPGYVGRERTLWRKIREAVLAIRMERRFSKAEILEMYLNQIYFGEGAYGIEAAAQEYFGDHVWGLELGEAATLAGIVAAPSRYSPRVNLDGATGRRDYVLRRMVTLGFVEETAAAKARATPIEVVTPEAEVSKSPYFVDYLKRNITRRYGDDVLYRGGLRIETTLDLRLQRAAEQAVASTLDQRGDPQASVVAVDVRTGGILAMVGGRDFERSQVNLATGQGGTGRQAGSAFKPFVLAQALQEGISPYSIYSAPGTISIDGWNVSNYGGSSYGSLSVRSATVSSVNTVFAQLIDEVGPDDVANLGHRMGIRSDLPAVPSLALGTAEVTPLEMASSYATLASGGVYRRPTPIARMTDSSGELVEELDREGRRVLPEATASEVTGLLQDVVAYGTGTAAQLSGVAVAGKTGTAQDHADAWFCGYTLQVAACVWVGYPRGRIPMTAVHGIPVTGGSFPALIWHAFMTALEGQRAPEATSAGPAPPAIPTGGSAGESGGLADQEGAPKEGPAPQPTIGGDQTGTVPDPPPTQPPPSPAPQPSPAPSDPPDEDIVPPVVPSPSPSA